MGEAIARFREAALGIRRQFDVRVADPCKALTPAAAEAFSSRCRELLREYEAGLLPPDRYAFGLRCARRAADSSADGPDGEPKIRFVQWLPPEMLSVPLSSIEPLADDALREALLWGEMFELVESRVMELRAACQQMVGEHYYHCRRAKWKTAFDALAAFMEEPPHAKAPAAAGSSPSQQTSSDSPSKARDRTGVGGRTEKWPKAMKQQILKDRSAYERKMKSRRQAPLKEEAWVCKEWATAEDRSITCKEALRLWRAAKRSKYR